jgi:hypothetical protein
MGRFVLQEALEQRLRRLGLPGFHVGVRQFEQRFTEPGPALRKTDGAFQSGYGGLGIALGDERTAELERLTGIGGRA